MSGARPRVTVALLSELLDDTDATTDPVLYLEGENLSLEIWASAEVSPHHRVVRKAELVEWFGYPVPEETLKEVLEKLQERVDAISF